MGVCREDLHKGGKVYMRSRLQRVGGNSDYKLQHCEVLDIFRAAARVRRIDDGHETTLRYNEMEPDEEYLEWRDQKEQHKYASLAAETDPPPPTPPTLKAAIGELVKVGRAPAAPAPAASSTAVPVTAVRKRPERVPPLAPEPEPEKKADPVQVQPQPSVPSLTSFKQLIESSRQLLSPIEARMSALEADIAELSVRMEAATSEHKELSEQRSALELLLGTRGGS